MGICFITILLLSIYAIITLSVGSKIEILSDSIIVFTFIIVFLFIIVSASIIAPVIVLAVLCKISKLKEDDIKEEKILEEAEGSMDNKLGKLI